MTSLLPYLAKKRILLHCLQRFNSSNEITVVKEQLYPDRIVLPYSQKLLQVYYFPSSSGISLSLRSHTALSSQRLTHFHTESHTLECRWRFSHLTVRCRISVRDLLMLLAILISSFSSESLYWVSWSRLRAQSPRFASSSACAVYWKIMPMCQPLEPLNVYVSFKAPKPPNWYTNITFQVIQKRTSGGLTHTSTSLLTTSISFGMFTAGWQYVANECRVATMEEGEREREMQKVEVREEGSGLRSWYTTHTKQDCLDGACWSVM